MIPRFLTNAIRQVLEGETDKVKKTEIKADIKSLETEGKLPPKVEPAKTETTTAPVAIKVTETPAVVAPASASVSEVKADVKIEDKKIDKVEATIEKTKEKKGMKASAETETLTPVTEIKKNETTIIASVVEAKKDGVATQEAKIEKAEAVIEKAEDKIKEIKKEEKTKASADIIPATVVIAPAVIATEEEKIKTRKEKMATIVAKSKMKKKVKEIAKKVESCQRLNTIKARIDARKKSAPAKTTTVSAKDELLNKLEVRKQIKESLDKKALLAQIEEKRKLLEARKGSKNRYLLKKAKPIKPTASDTRKEDLMKRIKAKRTVNSIVEGMEIKLGLKKK